MKSQFQAATLILLLLLVTFALGIEFGGSGLSGALGNFGPPTGNGNGKQSVAVAPPKLVVKAQGVNPQDLYDSSSYENIPSNMLVPLVGLRVTLLTQGSFSSQFRRLPALTLTTNSSGIASAEMLPGNYGVAIVGSTFTLETGVTLANNSTALLSVELLPAARPVSVLRIVSPDTVSGVESTSRLYALISNGSAPVTGLSELVGFVSSFSFFASGALPINGTLLGPMVSLNATLLGSYPGSQGYWATLYPAGTYPAYPSMNVMLFQFQPVAEVNYTAR